MSGESWTVYGLNFTAKLVVKVGLNVAMPGSGSAVDFAEAAKNFYDGHYLDALISTASGISDILTLGMSGAAKDLAKETGKEAVAQAAKENAQIAAKEASKKVGEDLAKNLATGTITSSGKAAAIKAAKASAASAAKEATKKVGKQVGKDLAKGVVNDAIEKVFYDGTKSTFQNLVTSVPLSAISSGGTNIFKTIAKDTCQEFSEKTLENFLRGGVTQGAKSFACEFAESAALKGAEKELIRYNAKIFRKDLSIAVFKGAVNYSTYHEK